MLRDDAGSDNEQRQHQAVYERTGVQGGAHETRALVEADGDAQQIGEGPHSQVRSEEAKRRCGRRRLLCSAWQLCRRRRPGRWCRAAARRLPGAAMAVQLGSDALCWGGDAGHMLT
eukprot:7386002-Prymnesium_polylepis.1